jgi:hypothetical protein
MGRRELHLHGGLGQPILNPKRLLFRHAPKTKETAAGAGNPRRRSAPSANFVCIDGQGRLQ